MKNKVTPSLVEKVMREDDFIVSKTDLQGRIIYGNEIFIEFSGYSERELLGAQHNIIRHPDMPRSVFHLLWERLKDGRECWAYVKNLAKHGEFYWVFANITPTKNERGDPVDYMSVRRMPYKGAVSAVADLYAKMLEEEKRAGSRDAIAAGTALLTGYLNQQGLGYDEFILSL